LALESIVLLALLAVMRSFLSTQKVNGEVEGVTEQSTDDTEKEVGVKNQDVSTDSDTDEISADAQPGVQDIEAVTKVWSKTHLVFAYIM
jgi:hypothetical protein